MDEKLHGTRFGTDFLNATENPGNKKKEKSCFINIENYCVLKDIINRVKKQAEWDKIFEIIHLI